MFFIFFLSTQIGDPSGKTSERPAMSLATINQNISGLKANLEAVFHNHETFIWNEAKTNKEAKLKPVIILNNGDWYKDINIIQFLREYGRHFRLLNIVSTWLVEFLIVWIIFSLSNFVLHLLKSWPTVVMI